jgi:Response regulator of the LytR/AlgR family
MTNFLRVMAVDDEPLALEFLASLLRRCPGVEVVSTCRNGREALIELGKQSVDVMFLDIQMPGLSGLDVIKRLQSDVMPLVIFATAHDDFALQAFDINAVDYLLKPIDADGVERALARARNRLLSRTVSGDTKGPFMSALMAMTSNNTGASGGFDDRDVDDQIAGKLAIKDGSETLLLPVGAIDWVDAAGDYMCIHSEGETHIMRSTMTQLLRRLPSNFVRIHRSTIVNADRVTGYETLPKGDLNISLPGDIKLKVSRNYKEQLWALVSAKQSLSS